MKIPHVEQAIEDAIEVHGPFDFPVQDIVERVCRQPVVAEQLRRYAHNPRLWMESELLKYHIKVRTTCLLRKKMILLEGTSRSIRIREYESFVSDQSIYLWKRTDRMTLQELRMCNANRKVQAAGDQQRIRVNDAMILLLEGFRHGTTMHDLTPADIDRVVMSI